MPNWCSNVLTITHKDPAKIASAKDAFVSGEFMNTLVPNPAGEWNYDWSVANWGCKWDVGDSDGINDFTDNSLVVYFDSAWSPPIGFYDKILQQGFTVEAYYYEPGMAFVGKWSEGDDEFYDLTGLDSSTVIAAIGNELDEMFSISENMAEYEQEQKDEVTKWWEQGVEELGLENA